MKSHEYTIRGHPVAEVDAAGRPVSTTTKGRETAPHCGWDVCWRRAG
jgi:hypothetical protein